MRHPWTPTPSTARTTTFPLEAIPEELPIMEMPTPHIPGRPSLEVPTSNEPFMSMPNPQAPPRSMPTPRLGDGRPIRMPSPHLPSSMPTPQIPNQTAQLPFHSHNGSSYDQPAAPMPTPIIPAAAPQGSANLGGASPTLASRPPTRMSMPEPVVFPEQPPPMAESFAPPPISVVPPTTAPPPIEELVPDYSQPAAFPYYPPPMYPPYPFYGYAPYHLLPPSYETWAGGHYAKESLERANRHFQAYERHKQARGHRGPVQVEIEREEEELARLEKLASLDGELAGRMARPPSSAGESEIEEMARIAGRNQAMRDRLMWDQYERERLLPPDMALFQGAGAGWMAGPPPAPLMPPPPPIRGFRLSPAFRGSHVATPYGIPEYIWSWDMLLRATQPSRPDWIGSYDYQRPQKPSLLRIFRRR